MVANEKNDFESIEIRLFDTVNGYIRHDRKRKWDKFRKCYPYQMISGIYPNRQNMNQTIYLSFDENIEKKYLIFVIYMILMLRIKEMN